MSFFFKILTIVFFLFTFSCKTKEKIPPNKPNEEIINFDFSFFETNSQDNSNYDFAASEILEWKSLLTDSLSFHKKILEETQAYKFEFQKDNIWLIDFNFYFNDKNYDAKLMGIVSQDSVMYKGFLSYIKELDTISDMLFITGKVYDNKTEEWKFNKPERIDDIIKPVHFLTINAAKDTLNIPFVKFTNNQSGENNLNYILKKEVINSTYKLLVDVFNKGSDNNTIIKWHQTNKIGRVKDPIHFGNENWHCWDENLIDVNCEDK